MNPKASRGRRGREAQIIPWGFVRRTLALLAAHRRWLGSAVVLTIAVTVLGFAGPYFLRELTNRVIAGDFTTFVWLILGSFAAALARAGANYFKSVSLTTASMRAIRDLRDRVAGHIQRLPFAAVASYRSGDLVSRINDDLAKTESLFNRVPDYIQRPLQLAGGLAFMLVLSPKLTLATCAIMPIAVFIFERVVRPMQRHSQREMEAIASVNASIQDAIRGASIIRAFGLQRVLGDRFRPFAIAAAVHGLRRKKRDILSFIPFLALRYVPQLVVPLYGGYLALRGEIPIGDMLAFDWLIWMVFGPLEALLAWIRELRETAPALSRTYEILDAPEERRGGQPIGRSVASSAIRFEDVAFAYEESAPVLNGLSFTVGNGETVALVGPSGCGKTTILRLACGFLDPTRGGVHVFDRNVTETDLASLRSQLSIVSQETYLFPVSIAENIAFGRPNASHDEIVAAASVAHADEFILDLPDGYQSAAGEMGSRLSSGQRQRICLARAILRDAPILLLDEPTASLDAASETHVLEALKRLMKGRTTLVVSHRLSTLRGVDTIYVLDDGRVCERGTHGELLELGGTYRRLYEQQSITNGPGASTSEEAPS